MASLIAILILSSVLLGIILLVMLVMLILAPVKRGERNPNKKKEMKEELGKIKDHVNGFNEEDAW